MQSKPSPDNYKTLLLKDAWIGPLLLQASAQGLSAVHFLPSDHHPSDKLIRSYQKTAEQDTHLQKAAAQLREYFAGRRPVFDIPIDLTHLSPFNRLVLMRLYHLPFGQVITYGDLARMLEKPGAARAVGAALARNPIPIIIPCHRVIAHDGHLQGYSAPGGIALKERLLRLEGMHVRDGRVQ